LLFIGLEKDRKKGKEVRDLELRVTVKSYKSPVTV